MHLQLIPYVVTAMNLLFVRIIFRHFFPFAIFTERACRCFASFYCRYCILCARMCGYGGKWESTRIGFSQILITRNSKQWEKFAFFYILIVQTRPHLLRRACILAGLKVSCVP